jgi:Na+-transporting NADH:ubiquinone oxidoreductase subunit C
MPKNIKSLVFAALLCVVCSVLLTAASTGLKPLQQRNIAVDRHKNILKAFGVVHEGEAPDAKQVERLYAQYVQSRWVEADGRILSGSQRSATALPLYTYVKNDAIEAYAIPIDTRGLWGTIHGYLALENDGTTIRGFTVYQHQETPGLGGEIESRWFRKNFEGKKITNRGGTFVSISVAKGKARDAVPADKRRNYVDGISGATMTGKYLTSGLMEILEEYEPVAVQFRHDKSRYLRVQ